MKGEAGAGDDAASRSSPGSLIDSLPVPDRLVESDTDDRLPVLERRLTASDGSIGATRSTDTRLIVASVSAHGVRRCAK